MVKRQSIFTLFTVVLSLFLFSNVQAQEQTIWERLQAHCGEAFEGELVTPKKEDGFSGKELVMHIRSCSDSVIYIPFFVGDDKSRTWVLRKQDIGYSLHHDHRHEDGTPEEQTMYGGFMSNEGNPDIYMFPSDQYTCELLPFACANVWWITMDDDSFTYNLRRVGTERVFTVKFDLNKKVKNPPRAWGH